MCGIVAYIGNKPAYPILINGLKRLEYRGYDSAGVAVIENGELKVFKKEGKVNVLEEMTLDKNLQSTIGIGHTRWATHGEPNDKNAHPHYSADQSLAIIHNGIFENYSTIKTELTNKGYSFRSDTDTEVLAVFIEELKKALGLSLEEALRLALTKIVGAYALVVISKDEPNVLYAARKGSPMVLGLSNDGYFIASDATPIIEYTNEVIYLNDGEVAIITREGYEIVDNKDVTQTPQIHKLDLKLEAIEKGGYEHFMLKEIMEQPLSIANCMRGRLNANEAKLTLGGIRDYATPLINAKKITFIACGTSWHAGLVAEYLFEDLCRIPVEVEYASEFRYRNPIISEGDIIIAISQSGETADTLA
ncbi:MAG: glucosamine--fructose-6-phosphate aminotransferase (isomerizing), partial [Flavobacteriaceae bacterium]